MQHHLHQNQVLAPRPRNSALPCRRGPRRPALPLARAGAVDAWGGPSGGAGCDLCPPCLQLCPLRITGLQRQMPALGVQPRPAQPCPALPSVCSSALPSPALPSQFLGKHTGLCGPPCPQLLAHGCLSSWLWRPLDGCDPGVCTVYISGRRGDGVRDPEDVVLCQENKQWPRGPAALYADEAVIQVHSASRTIRAHNCTATRQLWSS